MNPYGDGSSSSSDEQSQFGTARTYPEWSEFYLHNNEETEDEEDEFMSPAFRESDFFISPTEDKFITDNQFENTLGVYDKSSPEGSQTEASLDYLDKPFLFNNEDSDSKDYIGLDDKSVELERECFDGEMLGFSCEEDTNDDLKTGDEVNVTKDEEVDVVLEVEDEYEVFDLRIIHWKNRYDG